jgi:hypothetical protein
VAAMMMMMAAAIQLTQLLAIPLTLQVVAAPTPCHKELQMVRLAQQPKRIQLVAARLAMLAYLLEAQATAQNSAT